MKKMLLIKGILGMCNGPTSQTTYNFLMKLSNEQETNISYIDRGNNAEYESSICSLTAPHCMSDEDLDMILETLESNWGFPLIGNMFILDYDKGVSTPITFTKVLL